MAIKRVNNKYYLVIKNARMLFKNFEGRETDKNRLGDRNFCVVIDDPEEAQQLAQEGWNVKTLTARDGYDEDDVHYIQVKLEYKKGRPPEICVRTRNNELFYDEDTVKNIDYAELANVNLVLSPYHWEVNGKTGIKAYLKSLSATLIDDSFFFDEDDGMPFDVN